MRFNLYSQWNQLPESANILFAEREQESLFYSRIWFENLTSHALAEDQSILLACVVENESFLAILPMMRHADSSLSSLSNNFSSLYSLLISNNDQQDIILACLANGLFQMPALPILFEPIDTNDGNIIRLRQLMESYGFQSHSYFRFYNWIHPLNGQSFNEYMAKRPANLRNTIRRKKAKLKREHDYDIRLHKNAGIDQALADYNAIYKTSWKTNEYFSDFTPNLVKSLSRLGWTRFAILYINEQPVAAQIWFVVHGKANIYRLVFDENWKRYSPGSILTQYLMRYVIDTDKVSEIDFLTGNERYKQDWMTVRRERLGIRFAKQLAQKQKNPFSRAIQSLKKNLSYN
jgi:hypothetical protein